MPSCYLIHCPVPTSTFLGVLFCPSHACLDLLSIEAPDSEIHEPPGDRWCGLPHHYPATRESMEFLKHKATWKKPTDQKRLWNRHCFPEQRGCVYVCTLSYLVRAFYSLHCHIQTEHASAKRPKVLTTPQAWTTSVRHEATTVHPMPKGHLKRFQQPSRTPGIPHRTAWEAILITVMHILLWICIVYLDDHLAVSVSHHRVFEYLLLKLIWTLWLRNDD